jgi:hypothetical protein
MHASKMWRSICVTSVLAAAHLASNQNKLVFGVRNCVHWNWCQASLHIFLGHAQLKQRLNRQAAICAAVVTAARIAAAAQDESAACIAAAAAGVAASERQ